MKKLLVVVDFQNDFIDGALGTPEAVSIIPNVIEKIKNWDGDIVFTQDTHDSNYLETNEGKHLPVEHCIRGSKGWNIRKDALNAANAKPIKPRMEKRTFGSIDLAENIAWCLYDYVEFIGLCTDICVASNAIMAKAFAPEAEIVVDASCCAGTTPENHKAALTTMKMCQIEIKGEQND